MTHTYGIKIWMGTEREDSLSNDWCETMGGFRIQSTGFSPLQRGSPHTLDMDWSTDYLDTDLDNHGNSPITIGFYGPAGVGTPPVGVKVLSTGDWERILFHGHVASTRGALPPGAPQQRSYVGAEAEVFNAKTRMAAQTNSSIRDAMNEIELDYAGYNIAGGKLQFPDAFTGYQCDLPAQGGDTNGSYMDPAVNGYGISVMMEYDGVYTVDDLTSVDLWWRPSLYLGAAVAQSETRREHVNVDRPWLLGFPDIGRDWADYPYRLRVEGISHNATRTQSAFDGWLNSATVTTYIDNATDVGRSADLLHELIGQPHDRIAELVVPLEYFHQRNVAASDADADEVAWKLGAARVGDELWLKGQLTSGVSVPAGSPTTDAMLSAVIEPTISWEDGSSPVDDHFKHRISGITKEWTLNSGWVMRYSLHPINQAAPS